MSDDTELQPAVEKVFKAIQHVLSADSVGQLSTPDLLALVKSLEELGDTLGARSILLAKVRRKLNRDSRAWWHL